MNRDWNFVLSEAQNLYFQGSDTWTEIAGQLNIPRKTLREGLEREFKVESINDLGVQSLENAIVAPALIHPLTSAAVSVEDSDDAMVLLLSDAHYGASFEGDDLVPGYNSSLAVEYIAKIFEKAISVAQRMGVKRIYIAILGDMVDGTHLRIQHARETDLHLVDQVMGMVTILATHIGHLVDLGFEVTVLGVPGNHARVQKEIGSGHPAENVDTLIYRFLEKYCEGTGVQFHISDNWYLLHEIEGHGFLFTHGDEVKGNGNPGKKIAERAKQYQQRLAVQRRTMGHAIDLEYVVCGHFHQPVTHTELSFQVYVNGALQTGSEFISHRLGTQNPPMQKALLINQREGVFADFSINAF